MACEHCDCSAQDVLYEMAKMLAEATGSVLVPKYEMPAVSGPEADLQDHLKDMADDVEFRPTDELIQRRVAVADKLFNLIALTHQMRRRAQHLSDEIVKAHKRGPNLYFPAEWAPSGYSEQRKWLEGEVTLLDRLIKERIERQVWNDMSMPTDG